jgi:hypothetical protein
MVVPARNAGVKYSWFFCLAKSIPINNKKVSPDIKINVAQKPGVKKSLFPVCWSTAGGMAIMKMNSRKKKIEVEIFIYGELKHVEFYRPELEFTDLIITYKDIKTPVREHIAVTHLVI